MIFYMFYVPLFHIDGVLEQRSLIVFQTHRSTKRTEEDSAINGIRLLFSKYNDLVAIPKREVSENTIY